MLLPLDGQPTSEIAFIGLRALAGSEPQELRLLYAGDDPDGAHLAYLERVAGLFRDLGHRPSPQVRPGDPAQVIVETAQALPADLVILKRDEREGIKGWVLGSITDKVARSLRCPLLLMNPLSGDGRWLDYRIRQVMVPLDGSASAERAIAVALPLAHRLDARVTVMYSIPWLHATYLAGPEMIAAGSMSAQTDARLEADMHVYLDGLVARYGERPSLERIAMRGKAADAITVAAAKHAVDLIIMTTQGAGGILHRGLGRVAEAVTKRSGVPLLLVPPSS
ncbi:MAG: universal stress protein [Dehalococcoidia bacterium]